jgi:hypothetical protein
MKRGTTMLTAFAVVVVLALPSWAQVRELPTQTITIAGTIETIDQSKRAMNIKTADGKLVARQRARERQALPRAQGGGQGEGGVQQQRSRAPKAGGRAGGRYC